MKKHYYKGVVAFILAVFMSISMIAIPVYAAQPNYASTKISTWDGKKYTEPTVDGSWLVIDSASDLAWVLNKQNTKGLSKIKLDINVNLNNKSFKPIPSSIKEINGNGNSIKNWKINGTGAFSSTNSLKVYNLTLDTISISSSSYCVGAFSGSYKGNATFENCHVLNSSIKTTKGYAGGMIGYIARSSEKDRSSKLNVTFKNCSVNNTTIAGSKAEGKFVGAFSGYDNKENLTFTSCSSTAKVSDYSSRYIASNQSAFLNKISTNYNGFLGTEIYYRGTITFNSTRFIPKWDGKTSVVPLLANTTYDKNVTAGTNKYVIYSAFDLAGLRSKTSKPTALYLGNNIDMNGQGADGKYNVPSTFKNSAYTSKDDNNFNPFDEIQTLDGCNYTIYNLSICQTSKETGAFILRSSGTTVHKNINFRNCQTVSTHNASKSKDAKAYGAILIATAIGSNYTMSNVKAYNCRVFALQKVGTLAGRVGATKSTLKNNTVDGCYIENYQCNIIERFDSGVKKISSRSIRIYADFYPQGEVGGMYGFIQNESTITDCHVKNTKIHAFGQNDKHATMTGSTLLKLMLQFADYYYVPGRHVGTLIGDIRTTNGKTVKINNCTADSTNKCTNRRDKHNSTYTMIGQAYYIEYLDTPGAVYVNNKKLVLADCRDSTKR